MKPVLTEDADHREDAQSHHERHDGTSASDATRGGMPTCHRAGSGSRNGRELPARIMDIKPASLPGAKCP
jgi:hypothetical protein